MKNILNKIIGTYSERELKRVMPIVEKVEAFESKVSELSDRELKAKTEEFKTRYKNGETLDDLLPEAFAVVREASWRVLNMKHFKVQIIGGVVLHQGRIAEMKTGEGKTLVATLPAYLNAISGKGVHIVTVNDYLAKRDSEWMGKIYTFLGLKVGLIVHDMSNDMRREAYNADITYVTNNELGFDYLRDNMVIYEANKVQRGHNYAIVDEVDSILIDEARTPLIISGAGNKSNKLYETADIFARSLKSIRIKESDSKELNDDVDADYIIDEKAKSATLTRRGIKKAEAFFGIENLSDADNMLISHHVNQAIKAHGIMARDRDYVVKDGQVIIVDEFTGRLMMGRRYNEGLHQAIEAKEHVEVARESQTLATITFQNFFRLYSKLSGMTGTALTEEDEFQGIYNLDVIAIPTNKPVARVDHEDAVYKNEKGKLNAIVNQVIECHNKKQPILVGTVTIEKSEEISNLLKRKGIKHEVLNAKFHEKEAEIVAQAGKSGAVTIATNMAGRGTDIVLGGNPEFMAKDKMKKMDIPDAVINEAMGYADTDDEEILNARKIYHELYDEFKKHTDVEHDEVTNAGGLYILGTERHESRRIDNQLRGRSGRQGDIGESRFFISLEDDLMRLFGSDKISIVVDKLGLGEDQPIEAKILSNAIENAQKKVEARNFDIRKHVLQYDDVMNQQREIIYGERQKVLSGENIRDNIVSMIDYECDVIAKATMTDKQFADEWDWDTFNNLMKEIFFTELEIPDDEKFAIRDDELKDFIFDKVIKIYEQKEEEFGEERIREVERVVLLQSVDRLWMDHIDAMDQLRHGINLRAYGQHDPVIEYKFEGMDMFEAMVDEIKQNTVKMLYRVRINNEVKREEVAKPTSENAGGDESNTKKPVVKKEKIGRNDPCPCGSGKKYKKCCGANQ